MGAWLDDRGPGPECASIVGMLSARARADRRSISQNISQNIDLGPSRSEGPRSSNTAARLTPSTAPTCARAAMPASAAGRPPRGITPQTSDDKPTKDAAPRLSGQARRGGVNGTAPRTRAADTPRTSTVVSRADDVRPSPAHIARRSAQGIGVCGLAPSGFLAHITVSCAQESCLRTSKREYPAHIVRRCAQERPPRLEASILRTLSSLAHIASICAR
jgi:hypothetical protein